MKKRKKNTVFKQEFVVSSSFDPQILGNISKYPIEWERMQTIRLWFSRFIKFNTFLFIWINMYTYLHHQITSMMLFVIELKCEFILKVHHAPSLNDYWLRLHKYLVRTNWKHRRLSLENTYANENIFSI